MATAARDALDGHSPAGPVWRLAGNGRHRLHLADLPSHHGRPGPYTPGPPTPDQDPLHLLPPTPDQAPGRDHAPRPTGTNRGRGWRRPTLTGTNSHQPDRDSRTRAGTNRAGQSAFGGGKPGGGVLLGAGRTVRAHTYTTPSTTRPTRRCRPEPATAPAHPRPAQVGPGAPAPQPQPAPRTPPRAPPAPPTANRGHPITSSPCPFIHCGPSFCSGCPTRCTRVLTPRRGEPMRARASPPPNGGP